MIERRSILFHGLGLTLRRLPALLWTYFFNLTLALVFSAGLYHALSDILDHSLANQRLIGGFDLGTAAESLLQLTKGPNGGSPFTATHTGVLVYLLIYFLLVPGTLFCYQTATRARLGTLLQQGLLLFWRFVRITLLAIIVGTLIFLPLVALQNAWATHVDAHQVGRAAFFLRLTGLIILFLIGSLLRLYFDLVEVYTVQLGQHLRSNGKPDRRVRHTLRPALHTLHQNFTRAWLTFLFLTLLGAAAVVLTARTAMHMLAQPRVWPMFLLAQAGLFVMLLTRFWQRGAETSLVLQNPIAGPTSPRILPITNAPTSPTDPLHPKHPIWQSDVVEAPPSSHPSTPPSNHTTMSDQKHTGHHVDMIYTMDPLNPIYPAPLSTDDPLNPSIPEPDPLPAPKPIPDPIPPPEPASPSLDEPDPGVFHHDPTRPKP